MALRWFSRFVNLQVCATSIIVVGIFSGCGGSKIKLDPSNQATVSGTVKFEGKPIPVDSAVYFTGKETGCTAGGKIDALGNFTLVATDPLYGLKAGRYHVTVFPPAPPPVAASSSGTDYQQAMMKNTVASKKVANESPMIPKQFMSAETTKLILEVKPGPNKFDTIDLAQIK